MAGLWTAPFMFGSGKLLGGKAVLNGDCTMDPAAEDGVTLPEMVPAPDRFGFENVGAGGI